MQTVPVIHGPPIRSEENGRPCGRWPQHYQQSVNREDNRCGRSTSSLESKNSQSTTGQVPAADFFERGPGPAPPSPRVSLWVSVRVTLRYDDPDLILAADILGEEAVPFGHPGRQRQVAKPSTVALQLLSVCIPSTPNTPYALTANGNLSRALPLPTAAELFLWGEVQARKSARRCCGRTDGQRGGVRCSHPPCTPVGS